MERNQRNLLLAIVLQQDDHRRHLRTQLSFARTWGGGREGQVC